jgi:hypothetical protein
VFPYRVKIPERGVGQYKAEEVLGWRRSVVLQLSIIHGRKRMEL